MKVNKSLKGAALALGLLGSTILTAMNQGCTRQISTAPTAVAPTATINRTTYTQTPTPVNTNTPSDTPTITQTPVFTATPTNTFSFTGTPTVTFSNTATNTPSNTPVYSSTFTFTPTNTGTNTPSGTPTPSPTNTSTYTRTFTPTVTSTSTVTNTPTNTPTPYRTLNGSSLGDTANNAPIGPITGISAGSGDAFVLDIYTNAMNNGNNGKHTQIKESDMSTTGIRGPPYVNPTDAIALGALIYVGDKVDSTNSIIYVYDHNFADQPTIPANGYQIDSITADGNGNLFFADSTNKKIVRYNIAGTTFTDWSQTKTPIKLASDRNNNVYVLFNDSTMGVFAANGTGTASDSYSVPTGMIDFDYNTIDNVVEALFGSHVKILNPNTGAELNGRYSVSSGAMAISIDQSTNNAMIGVDGADSGSNPNDSAEKYTRN